MSETVTAQAEPDPTYFENRYPRPDELLRDGGLTGVQYCFVSGANQRKFAEDKDEEGYAWSPIKDLPALTFAGPKGTVDTVVLMGRGDPVTGAGDGNGIRLWFVDIDIEERTGIPTSKDTSKGTPPTNNSRDGAADATVEASRAGKK